MIRKTEAQSQRYYLMKQSALLNATAQPTASQQAERHLLWMAYSIFQHKSVQIS